IRRELLDLAKYHRAYRRKPQDAEVLPLGRAPGEPGFRDEPIAADDSADLETWERFHNAIGELPPEECEVVGLIFYHGCTQVEAAQVLQIDERTVRRRWSSACENLKEKLPATNA